MGISQLRLRSLLNRRALVVGGIVCVALLVVAATPQLLGSDVKRAFAGLAKARPEWLWLAAVAFVTALLANAWAWRSTIHACGGEIGRVAAAACYGVGSLVNTAAPARIGDAARIALFTRAFDGPDRVWTTGGVSVAIGAARALCLGVLVVCAALIGALPWWPVAVIAALVGTAVVVAFVVRGRTARRRVAHLLDALRALGRSPRRAVAIVAWVALATGARVAAAAAIATALGVSRPVVAAVIIVPALDLASVIPLTPGNLGIASGTVAVALRSEGVDLTRALTTGIALHALESIVSIVFGAGGALVLARFSSPRARQRTMLAAGTGAAVALLVTFSATVLVDIV
jgi:uncharacterized membrane protein YbhN (UPF0104 family)